LEDYTTPDKGMVFDLPVAYTYNSRVRRNTMQKKLTVMIDEEVYEGLRRNIGPRKIGRFIQELVRPHVIFPDLESRYAQMAKDEKREREAMEWAENTFKELSDETR
jgi:hypothetical protein